MLFFKPAIILAFDFSGQKMCERQLEIAAWIYSFASDQRIPRLSFDTLNCGRNTLI